MVAKSTSTEDKAAIELAMQFALDDILTHKKQPSQDDLAVIPPGEMTTIINALSEALKESGELGVKKAFKALVKDKSWLVDLRKKPIPLRPRPEDEEAQDPRFRTSENGKTVIVLSTEDDIEALPDREDLIEDVLEKGTVSMIYGPAGTGKTFNALHIAYCVAHGVSWFGHKTEKGKIWYINTEGGRGLKPRIAAWRKEYQRGKSPNIKFIPWPVHLKDHSLVLLDTIAESTEKPDLLVVDNYSMCASGTTQNDQMEVTMTLMVLHEIAKTYGCHCLLVHHSNWTGKVNGSAAFRNHVDTMIDLSRANKDSPIILKCEKQRDGEGFADKYLELKIVSPYAHPVTGKFITSCVVTTTEAPPKENTISKKPSEQKMHQLLEGKKLTYTEWTDLGVSEGKYSISTAKTAISALERAGHVQKDETSKPHKYSVVEKAQQERQENRPNFSISDNMLDVLKRMEQEKGHGIVKDDWMQEYALEWKFEVDGIRNMFGRTIDTLLMNNEICCNDGFYSTARIEEEQVNE